MRKERNMRGVPFLLAVAVLLVFRLAVSDRPKEKTPSYTVSDTVVVQRDDYPQREEWDVRSIVDVNCFYMDDDENQWTEAEIESFHAEVVLPALSWIEKQAAAWDVKLEMCSEKFGVPLGQELRYEGVFEKDLDFEQSQRFLIRHVARDLGLNNEWGLWGHFWDTPGYRYQLFLVFFNKEGRSYAFPGGVHYGVIFASRETRATASVQQTVAHELLHLFGAQDMYMPEARQEVARALYPKDVMLGDTQELGEAEVTHSTAYAMAWTDEIPLSSYIVEWWQEETEEPTDRG